MSVSMYSSFYERKAYIIKNLVRTKLILLREVRASKVLFTSNVVSMLMNAIIKVVQSVLVIFTFNIIAILQFLKRQSEPQCAVVCTCTSSSRRCINFCIIKNTAVEYYYLLLEFYD